MMGKPQILLLDEPLSALDPQLRAQLQTDILALHKEFGTTTLMVSHDPSEIYRLASRVLVLDEGSVLRSGSPKEVLLRTSGSQKFSFEGELLELYKADVLNIGVVSIGSQLVEVVLDSTEARQLRVGERVRLGTKAFAPIVSKAQQGRLKL
jgi:molybdate transport system ATP-binding protein